MKPSSVRLKLIAGTLGVLAISHPHRLEAQTPLGEAGRPLSEEGRPLREEGRPLREEGTPLSREGTPLGQVGRPIGEGAVPLAKVGTPLSQEGTPLSQEGTPLSQEGTPLSQEGRPLSQEGTPLSQEGTPLSQEGTPLSHEGTPLAHEGIPLADYGTPSQQAAELRRRNQAATMNNPETSRFFGGDEQSRRMNASKNLAAAVDATPAEDPESVSQQDADDREWSRGMIDSAESRPRDLFSSDWWEKHPDVMEGDAKYYTAKPANAWWQGSPWGDLVRVLGMRDVVAPFKYRADRNVVFNSDLIYVNGQPVSSYDDYVHSARSLVEPNPQEVGKRQGWYPLGTFAVSANSKTRAANHAFQLAMDSLGNIAGVSVNWPEGKLLPIRGRVDTNTKRVAFSVGGSDTVVVETGLANLTDPYTRAWAHLPNSHSQTWLLARIRE